MAGPQRLHVFELREKAKFLMTHPVPLGRIRQLAPISITQLAKLSKIPLASLQDAINVGGGASGAKPGDEKLGLSHQQLLGGLYRFAVRSKDSPKEAELDEPWPEWSDPDADDRSRGRCRDSAKDFERRYLREHRRSARTQSAAFAWNPPTTRAQVLKRLKAIALEERTGSSGGSLVLAFDAVTFEGEELKLACIHKDGQQPRSKDKDLATIELHWPTRNEGVLPWSLHLDLNLGRSDGLFARESKVEFGLGKHAQVEEFAKREQFPGSQNVVRPNGRPVAAKSGLKLAPGGDSFEPHYVVGIPKGPIGPFTFYGVVKLTKIAAGQEVQVRLVAAIKDLTEDGESGTRG